jgi:hypothetical protein
MIKYIGTKQILCESMSKAEYNEYRGWTLPEDECGDDKGYLVKDAYNDYISWLPTEQLEANYTPTDSMNFGLAIEAMRLGKKVARSGWNGKNMWVCLMPPLYLANPVVNDRTRKFVGDCDLDCQAYFVMWTAQQQWQPGWLASQADMLALDWQILE